MSDQDPEQQLRRVQIFVIDHLQEELNAIGGVVGYKIILTPDETEALLKLLDNAHFWRS